MTSKTQKTDSKQEKSLIAKKDFKCSLYDVDQGRYIKYTISKGDEIKSSHPLFNNLKTEGVI